MNRATIINSVVAVAIVSLVAGVFVLDSDRVGAPMTTTTTSTTLPATTTSTSTTTTTTTTTTTSTTSTTSTTTTSTVPPTTEPPFYPRELWKVVVVNGTSGGERLAPTIQQLRDVGYVELRGLVGSVRTSMTVVYFSQGAESAADRLRVDLGLDSEVLPLEEAPPIAGRNDAQLVLYLGGA